jgi:CDP-glucose 4,6-dehydratase
VRDYFYIEDATAAYIMLAEKVAGNSVLHGEAFNFSNETPVSVLEIVERISKTMRSSLKPVILNEASNEIREQYLSSAKARKLLKWKPLVTLDEGLSRTVSWYRDFLSNE